MQFRAGQSSVGRPDPYGNPQGVGQPAGQSLTSASNVADPRRVSLPIDSVAINQPASRRKWRGGPAGSGDHPIERERGYVLEPPNPYSIGVGNGYGPTGAPDPNPVEPETHLDGVGGPRISGVGLVPSGGYDAPRPNPVDLATARGNPRTTDQRRNRVTTGAPIPSREVGGPYAWMNRYRTPQNPESAALIPDQKPPQWWHQGRQATRTSQLFFRPFDKLDAPRLTGRKLRIGPPPTYGQIITTTGMRASFPIQTSVEEDTVTGTAYHGPRYGAPGMTAGSGPRRNTFRALPQPWDTYLIDTGGPQ